MYGTRVTLVLVVLLVAAAPTRASISTYSGLDNPRGSLTNSKQAESDFLAALTSFGTDKVDSFANHASNPTLVFGGTGITAKTNNVQVSLVSGLPVSSPNFLQGFDGDEVFTFSEPVHGFGAYLIGLGNGFSNTLTFVLANTLLATSQDVVVGPFGPGANNNNVAYFGVIDAANPFNRVTVKASDNDDSFSYDNLTVGFAATGAVPEFSSLATWAGLCAIGLLARRRL